MSGSLSLKKRWEIVFLATHPHGPKFGPTKIATIVKCSKSTVSFWLSRYRATGDVADLTHTGRPPTTSIQQDHKILAASTKNPQASTTSIANNMKQKGVDVSTTTVWRRLKAAGLSYKPVLKKPLLTELHCEKRLTWATEHQHTDWSQVLFTDETTFKLHQQKNRAWQHHHQRAVMRTRKHPAKVHVWGCVSASGFGKCCTFTGNLNAHGLIKIYKHALLPSAQALFGKNYSTWILQEDNDPKHKSRLATTWKASQNISTLPWPAQSPDQNCIENAWAVLKANVATHKPRTVQHL